MLNPQVFQILNQQIGPFVVDIFATRLTKQLTTFFSLGSDPESAGVDVALAQDLSRLNRYALLESMHKHSSRL